MSEEIEQYVKQCEQVVGVAISGDAMQLEMNLKFGIPITGCDFCSCSNFLTAHQLDISKRKRDRIERVNTLRRIFVSKLNLHSDQRRKMIKLAEVETHVAQGIDIRRDGERCEFQGRRNCAILFGFVVHISIWNA